MIGGNLDIAAMARPATEGQDGKFFCRRVNAYTSREECISSYHFALDRGDKYTPCLECAKVRQWLSDQNTIKNAIQAVAWVAGKKDRRIDLAIKKNQNIVEVDFTDYPELFKQFSISAKEKFRTPAQQLLSIANSHVEGRRAARGQSRCS